jgi:hypothetical protein
MGTTKTTAKAGQRTKEQQGIKTVGELIARLQCFNPNLPVLRETESFGASGIEDCRLITNTGTPDDLQAFVFIGPRDDEED